jgi:hypothetical protein
MGYGPIVNGKQTPITPWKGSWAEQEERKRAGKPYFEQIELAKRWDKCVDAGSPITAQRK